MIELFGKNVDLVPPKMHHAEQLVTGGSLEMFRYTLGPEEWTAEGIMYFFDIRSIKSNVIPFVIVEKATGEAVGSSSFIQMVNDHHRVEIGSTWVSFHKQGTLINKEAKYLMLQHAFETWQVLRVEFKLDKRNIRSAKALESIGAVYEGTLRKHMILRDGSIRDSMYYSIVDDEWPAVKAKLAERIYP